MQGLCTLTSTTHFFLCSSLFGMEKNVTASTMTMWMMTMPPLSKTPKMPSGGQKMLFCRLFVYRCLFWCCRHRHLGGCCCCCSYSCRVLCRHLCASDDTYLLKSTMRPSTGNFCLSLDFLFIDGCNASSFIRFFFVNGNSAMVIFVLYRGTEFLLNLERNYLLGKFRENIKWFEWFENWLIWARREIYENVRVIRMGKLSKLLSIGRKESQKRN